MAAGSVEKLYGDLAKNPAFSDQVNIESLKTYYSADILKSAVSFLRRQLIDDEIYDMDFSLTNDDWNGAVALRPINKFQSRNAERWFDDVVQSDFARKASQQVHEEIVRSLMPDIQTQIDSLSERLREADREIKGVHKEITRRLSVAGTIWPSFVLVFVYLTLVSLSNIGTLRTTVGIDVWQAILVSFVISAVSALSCGFVSKRDIASK